MICFGVIVMYCQLQGAPVPTDTFCQLYQPVYWSATDSRKTKEQIDTNNRKYKRLCNAK